MHVYVRPLFEIQSMKKMSFRGLLSAVQKNLHIQKEDKLIIVASKSDPSSTKCRLDVAKRSRHIFMDVASNSKTEPQMDINETICRAVLVRFSVDSMW